MLNRSLVIVNFEELKTAAIKACNLYIDTYQPGSTGLFSSLFNNQKGYCRARQLKAYLELKDINNLNLFALILAVIGHPDDGFLGFKWGRSSDLASFISSNCILGIKEQNNLENTNIDTLKSNIFSSKALSFVAKKREHQNRSNIDEEHSMIYFDKTTGTRDLLNMALALDFGHFKQILLAKLPIIKAKLDDCTLSINTNILIDLEAYNEFKKQVMVAAFANAPDEKRAIFERLRKHIAGFLPLTDMFNVARTNRVTWKVAQTEMEKISQNKAR